MNQDRCDCERLILVSVFALGLELTAFWPAP
jgi:hypothetical protein